MEIIKVKVVKCLDLNGYIVRPESKLVGQVIEVIEHSSKFYKIASSESSVDLLYKFNCVKILDKIIENI